MEAVEFDKSTPTTPCFSETSLFANEVHLLALPLIIFLLHANPPRSSTMMFGRQIIFAAAALLTLSEAQPPSDSVTVGQEICSFGYVMDEYCIVS